MKHLMLLSTHTGVGKHTIACGLLRLFTRRGLNVSPFKGVSIEQHTCLLPDGTEISFALALQAMAASKIPLADINPYVALYAERFSLIELGQRLARPPHTIRDRQHFLAVIESAFQRVSSQVDLAVIEGAGSPVELGLEEVDLTNVPVARMADARILLVTEMTHGGGYASVVGTCSLLPDDIRDRLVGVVLNKFDIREPAEAGHAGMAHLSQIIGRPVMSLPFLRDTFVPGDVTHYPTEYGKFADYTEAFDQLADVVETHLDIAYLQDVLGATPAAG